MNTRPIENSTWSRWLRPYMWPVERALQHQPERRRREERQRQAGQERHARAVHQEHRHVAAGHGEGAVREVDEIHQAQRHGEPAGQHEQQHAVGDAVEEDGRHG